jgi:glycosyltransferase involved in cell wall biosynthesis
MCLPSRDRGGDTINGQRGGVAPCLAMDRSATPALATQAPPADAPGARVLALIPAHDEGPRISAVVRGARAHLPVLVVDDGSADDTAARAQEAGATLLLQRPNRGKGEALRAGFRWALEAGFEAVVTLDGDGQHDPTEIPTFLAAYRAGQPDLVIGRRDFARMPFTRRLANASSQRVFSWAVGLSIPDNQSGYRLLDRRLMADLATSREAGFEFEVEMITTCIRRGYRLEWVPIRTIYAGEPSHIQPLRHVSHFLRVAWQARRTVHRPPD